MERGRGASFLWAVSNRVEAQDLLVGCLASDPRWDRQVESRGFLYSEIAEATALESAPVIAVLDAIEPQEAGWCAEADLALQVLTDMAVRGDEPARSALRRQVEYGPLWADAVGQVECEESLWPGYGDLLAKRLRAEGFAERFVSQLFQSRIDAEPWLSWRTRHADLERAAQSLYASGWARPPRRPEHKLARQTTQDLIELSQSNGRELATRRTPDDVRLLREAALTGEGFAKRNALEALGRQGDPSLIDEALRPLRAVDCGSLRAAAHRYLRELPADISLGPGREWFVGEPALRSAGEMILERHGQPSDLPLLVSELTPALRQGEMHRLCSILEALVRFPEEGPFPAAEDVFVEVPYSYARIRAVRILRATDKSFRDRFSYECLWDCEGQIRDIAVEAVDRGRPGAAGRIEALQE
jgi:hypothetical protein